MTTLRRLLTSASATATLFVASSFGSTVVQTFNVPTLTSDVTALQTAATFNFFGSSAGVPGGSVLSGVTLQVTLHDAVTGLEISNTTGQAQDYTEELSVKYTLGGSAPDIARIRAGNNGVGGSGFSASTQNDIYTIGDPLAGPPAITEHIVNNGDQCWVGPCGGNPTGFGLTGADYAKVNLNGATGDGVWTSGVVSATSVANYAGVGTFTISYASLTQQTNSTGANFNPIDQSFATYQVIYTYGPASTTPEPTTMVLFGSALLGLGFLRRRKA